MVTSETVVALVACRHPQEKTFPIAQVGILGASDYCSACGAWRDEGKQDWTRPELVEAIALEGVRTEPKPPSEEVATRRVGAFELTPNADGTITVCVQREDGAKAWRFLSIEATIRLAEELLTQAGANASGVPTLGAFGEHSSGRREPDSPAPLRGMVSEAIGATMRPTFLLGWLRGVVDMALEATPGSEEFAWSLGALRRVVVVVDQELARNGDGDTLPPPAEANGDAAP